jgi:hypothetical protein
VSRFRPEAPTAAGAAAAPQNVKPSAANTMSDGSDDRSLDTEPINIVETPLAEGGIKLSCHPARRQRSKAEDRKREPARIITMVWGERYIDDLLKLTLPALLAPGNIPAFVEHFDAEMVIVTETRFFDVFAANRVVARLLEHCNVRLLPIDDLLSNWYGITLTYALVRGFVDLGEAMVDTHLLFVNADFILAEDSYRKLAEAILRGERLVVSPSYCMVQEDTLEELHKSFDEATCSLAVPHRQLAKLIIDHRHNTIRAKTVNQRLFRIHRYDQFYWYVNESTMLGRQMPIAVVYMRPERAIMEMPTFWDYGVVSQYCPTTKPCVLGDSDDFLMAELRAEATFRDLLHPGWPTPKEIAVDLSSFTTQDHRDYGRHDLTLHAADLPPQLDAKRRELRKFVDDIYARLRPPVSYINHPFWIQGFPRFDASRIERRQQMVKTQQIEAALREHPVHTLKMRQLSELRVRHRQIQQQLNEIEREANETGAGLRTKLAAAEDSFRRAQVDYGLGIEKLRADADKRRLPLKGESEDIKNNLAEMNDLLAREINRQTDLAADLAVEEPLAGAQPDRADKPIKSHAKLLARLRDIYGAVFGHVAQTTKLHPYDSVLRHLKSVIAEATSDSSSRTLQIGNGGSVGRLALQRLRGELISVTPRMAASPALELETGYGGFNLCLCDLTFDDLFQVREITRHVLPLLRKDGKIIIFYLNYPFQDLDSATFPFTRSLFPLIGQSGIWFTGSLPAKIALQRFTRDIASHDLSRVRGICAFALSLAITAPLAVAGWWLERRTSPQRLPKYCTSMMIEIRPL